MKKMLIVLLSLGMVLSGCFHSENPEETPVVEDETEKQQTKFLSVVEKFEEEGFVDEYAIINNSTNEYYNWLTNYDNGKALSEHLHLNLEGDFADEINLYFDEYYKKIEEKGFVSQFIAGWEEVFDDILCLTIRYRNSASGGMYKIQWIESYNVDLKTNQPLNNEELLNRFGLDFEKAQSIIDAQLEKDNISITKENEDPNKDENMKLEISNDSFLTIDNQGNLYVIVTISTKRISMFDGELMRDFLNYYFIKLN